MTDPGEATMSQASDAPALPYPIPVPADSALEPPAEWARLRQDRPMAPVVLPSGDGAALITRYADVKQVLADPRCTRVLSADDAARLTDSESGGVFNSEVAATLTDASHARWRPMLSRWFTAKRMSALRPGLEAVAYPPTDNLVVAGSA